MSATYTLREARPIAEEIAAAFSPYCERIKIAGSIRRERAYVKDIEIVCIPKVTIKPPDVDIFGEPVGAPVAERDPGFLMVVDSLADPHIKGDPKQGRYIQFGTRWGIKVDLFTATPQTWGYIMAIRTGSADFSHALALLWSRQGYKGKGGVLTRGGAPVDIPEESDLFNRLGMRTPHPSQREMTVKGLGPWMK